MTFSFRSFHLFIYLRGRGPSNNVDVFNKKKAEQLFEHDRIDHVIKIKNDKKFSFESIYNLSVTELKILRKYVKKNFKKKFIISFFFSTDASVLFVFKSNNELKLCVNYRNLNVIIKKNRYLFFLINQLLNRLIDVKLYTKLNIRFAYNALKIKKKKMKNNVSMSIRSFWISRYVFRIDKRFD